MQLAHAARKDGSNAKTAAMHLWHYFHWAFVAARHRGRGIRCAPHSAMSDERFIIQKIVRTFVISTRARFEVSCMMARTKANRQGDYHYVEHVDSNNAVPFQLCCFCAPGLQPERRRYAQNDR